MTIRPLLWGGSILLVLAGIWLGWELYGIHSITFSEAQIQEKINAQLDKDIPVKGISRAIVKSVRLESATVHIDDGHVMVLADVEGTILAGKKFTLTSYFVGVPKYGHQAFYFDPDNVEVQKFAYEGNTPTELFNRFTHRYISDEKQQLLVADVAPKVEVWMSRLSERVAVHVLNNHAVYRPKDDVKGWLIKASLQSVSVVGDHIVATFSLWQLTLSVLVGIVVIICAALLVVGLILNPEIGLAFILFS